LNIFKLFFRRQRLGVELLQPPRKEARAVVVLSRPQGIRFSEQKQEGFLKNQFKRRYRQMIAQTFFVKSAKLTELFSPRNERQEMEKQILAPEFSRFPPA